MAGAPCRSCPRRTWVQVLCIRRTLKAAQQKPCRKPPVAAALPHAWTHPRRSFPREEVGQIRKHAGIRKREKRG